MVNSKNIGYRPTWAEINLDNLAYNFRRIKKMLAPKTKVLVTVKADAYGHGLVPVAQKLESLGVDFLGVASIDEGIKLREAGINIPILVLSLILKKDIAPLFRYNLTTTVCDEALVLSLQKKAGILGIPAKVHIKIDTGMGRLGVLYKDAQAFIEKIHKLKSVKIEGVFTHFPSADIDRDFTSRQIGLFNRLVQGLDKKGIHIPLVHAANSMGVIGYKNSHFNMVRPGLVIYGLYPKEVIGLELKPVLSLKTRVVFVKKMPEGHGISYGRKYIAKKNTKIVILPIGYGDGYPRNLSNLAPVLIKGRRFKISGRICMDQMMADVGKTSVSIGDEAVLIGSQGRNRISAEELACLCDTIPYEIVCGLGSRIPRIYL